MLRDSLSDQPNLSKIAVIEGETGYTYKELIEKSLSIAVSLPESRWETAAIYLPDGSDAIAALFGILRLGKTALPINHRLTKHELLPLLLQSGTDIIITSKAYLPVMEELSSRCDISLRIIYAEDCLPGQSMPLPIANGAGEDKPMILLTTSGSTGRAKIVPLSENNIAASAFGYLDRMDYAAAEQSDMRYLLAAPFSSAYGLMILFACLLKSFPLVLLREGFTLDAFYKSVEGHRVTHYEGGAAVLLLMEQTVEKPVRYDIRSLKYFGFGGSKVSGETLRKLIGAYPGINFWQGYGMTEAAPLIAKYIRTDAKKLDSVGRAIKGVEIFIEDSGTPASTPYTVGEILVKGPNVMSGYYRNEEETAKVLKNGYLYTGDLGYLDEDGYLYIRGRKKNVIIVRGFNVYPEEVETCILNSQLVSDCIVYGETEPSGNEIVCADIVPADASTSEERLKEEIGAFCKAHLSGYKQPKKLRFVDAVKKTLSGKTERKREL